MSGNVQSPNGKPFSVSAYRPLILDKRISHGAFRLWHYLHNRMDADRKCWPTQRDIAANLGCKPHSLKEWIYQLTSTGYLAVERYGPHHNFRYMICAGDGNAALPEWTTRKESRIAQKGNTESDPRCPKGHTALPERATRRVAQKGNLSNPNLVNPISKGDSPSLSLSEKISLEKELQRVMDEISVSGSLDDYPAGSSKRNRLLTLLHRRTTLRETLGVVA